MSSTGAHTGEGHASSTLNPSQQERVLLIADEARTLNVIVQRLGQSYEIMSGSQREQYIQLEYLRQDAERLQILMLQYLHLRTNSGTDYGPPLPASKSAVEALVNVKVSKELLESEMYSECAVCTERFEIGTDTKELPCCHLYHPDCILPWLGLHNSCPLCRYELPTDNPVHENNIANLVV